MLILIRGLPGSGKSTFARDYDIRHYEADMFFIQPDGEYEFNPGLIKQAHEWCQTSVRCALYARHDVVVSNTFTTLKEMQPYIDFAKNCGAELKVYRMTGNYGSIHNVPEETIERMRNRFEDYEGEILFDGNRIVE